MERGSIMITQETPVNIRTDKYEIQIYPRSRKVRFARLVIKAGEIVAGRTFFTLTAAEFLLYPKALKYLKATIGEW